MIKFARKIFNAMGYDLVKRNDNTPIADLMGDAEFMQLYQKCRPYTTTSIERLYSLYKATNYIIDNRIDGDLVECGVWKGGSALMMALVLTQRKEIGRRIFLYDTFEGMSAPTDDDKSVMGEKASDLLEQYKKSDKRSIWFDSPIEEVKSTLKLSSYPDDLFILIKGKVEDTLLNEVPQRIALLRLDTDWYESTKMELKVLYPILNKEGVLIIDDFGHWEGAKKAVLEFFKDSYPYLHRIDNTGRLYIKP